MATVLLKQPSRSHFLQECEKHLRRNWTLPDQCTCVADNNSANLAFMAIATKRAHLELQDEIFTLKFIQMYLFSMEIVEVAMAQTS